MKKFILLLVVVAVSAMQTEAQVLLPARTYIYEYTGLAKDSVTSVVPTWNKIIQLNKIDGLFYNASVKVADLTAGATCTIKLRGRMFLTDTPTDITTYTWAGGGTDTTFIFTANTNKTYYRFLDFLITRTANKVHVAKIQLSLKK